MTTGMAANRRRMQWALVGGTLLLGLSIAGLWAYVDLVNPLPFYTAKYDPEIPYLLNSLSIFKSRPYMYFDHPGTPVEVIGTVLLAAMRPALRLGSEGFWTYVIAKPESFLRIAHGLLTFGSMATLALISLRGVRVERWSDVPIALGAGASFFVLLPEHTFRSLNFWSHNSFNFPVGTLILLALFHRLRSERPLEGWEIVLAGVSTGALTAVQLYFATWVLGAACSMLLYVLLSGRGVLRGLLTGAMVGVSALVGFVLATGPILHRYREFAWWVRSLIVHQGRFGTGPPGLPSAATLLTNLKEMLAAAPLFSIAVGLALGLVMVAGYRIRRSAKRYFGWWALSAGLVVQVSAVLFLIAKQPALQYFLGPAAIVPILLVLAFDGLRTEAGGLRGAAAGIGLAILVLFVISLFGAISAHRTAVSAFERRAAEIEQHIEAEAVRAGKRMDSMVILWGNGMETRCYALRFGDRYTERAFRREINEMCAHDWTYEVSADLAELPDGTRPLGESQGWDMLIIRSSDRRSDLDEAGQLTSSSDGSILFLRPEVGSP